MGAPQPEMNTPATLPAISNDLPSADQLFNPTLPSDIVVFGTETTQANTFLPSTAVDIGSRIDAWDPWTHADVAKMLDHSMPISGEDNYGEPSDLAAVGDFVGTWGGMPYPVRDYNDEMPSVAIVPKSGAFDSSGPAGQYAGQQMNAQSLLQNAAPPVDDYWSVLLGVG